MKRFVLMVLAVAAAAILYFVGCGVIDAATASEPDYIGTMTMQPDFTNTVRSW